MFGTFDGRIGFSLWEWGFSYICKDIFIWNLAQVVEKLVDKGYPNMWLARVKMIKMVLGDHSKEFL